MVSKLSNANRAVLSRVARAAVLLVSLALWALGYPLLSALIFAGLMAFVIARALRFREKNKAEFARYLGNKNSAAMLDSASHLMRVGAMIFILGLIGFVTMSFVFSGPSFVGIISGYIMVSGMAVALFGMQKGLSLWNDFLSRRPE